MRQRDADLWAAERKSVAGALRGELLAMNRHLATTAMRTGYARFGQEIGFAEQKVPVAVDASMDTPVFRAHVGQIGLLPPDLASRVSEIYGRLAPPKGPQPTQVDLDVATAMLELFEEGLRDVVAKIDQVVVALAEIADASEPA